MNFDYRLTKEQLLAVLKIAREHNERDFLMILLAANHALRASEVCFLKVSNFDLGAGEIFVKRLKGSNATCHPLVSNENPLLDERTAITAWLQGKTGRIFDIERRMFLILFKRYCKQAGIPAKLGKCHVLKHTCCHAILDSGASLPTLQRYTGHVSLSSLGFYLQKSESEAAREAQANLWKS